MIQNEDSTIQTTIPSNEQAAYQPAVQSRGAETERKFRAAAEHCFSKRGYAGTKVSDIIQQSECSIGSYYHRFKDKRALFDVMLLDYVEFVGNLIDTWDVTLTTRKDLRGLLSLIAKEFRLVVSQAGGFLRAAQELAFTEPKLWQRLSDLSLQLWLKLEKVLPQYLPEILAEDPKLAMRGAVQTILTLMLQASLSLGQLFPSSMDEVEDLAINAGLGVLYQGKA